jgi:hypothetical protein
MSHFPYRKGVNETRKWLDANGFEGHFDGWCADALFHIDREDVFHFLPKNEAYRLLSLLNYAKASQEGIIHFSLLILFLSYFVY